MRTPKHVRIKNLAAIAGLILLTVFATMRTEMVQAGTTQPHGLTPTVTLVPDQMKAEGDVSTHANTVGHCTADRLQGTPQGALVLGMNPESCEPAAWRGGTISATVSLPAPFTPTLYVIRLAWSNGSGRGIHSAKKNNLAKVEWDGQVLFAKRTLDINSENGEYYAAQHGDIVTTAVVYAAADHELSISVPPNTVWDLSKIEFTAYPYPDPEKEIKGVGYSPYRDCQAPTANQPTEAQIRQDFRLLANTANTVRTYSATGVNRMVPALALEAGMAIYPGAWLDGRPSDETEVQALLSIANSLPVDGVIVGSEYYLRHRTPQVIADLVTRIKQVKGGLHNSSIPVMTAELDNQMFMWDSTDSVTTSGIDPAYKPVLDAVDYVVVHIYPYWNEQSVDGAATKAIQRYQAMKAALAQVYPDQPKRLIIGETGWPSGGQSNILAVPTLANQQRYMLEFLLLAHQLNVDYFYFGVFDEFWKTAAEGPVGAHWGYSYGDRTAKHPFFGVLVPPEQLAPNPVRLPLLAKTIGSSSSIAYRAEHAVASDTKVPIRPAYANPTQGFPVYTDWFQDTDTFVPAASPGATFDECDRSDPYEGEMSIKATYVPTAGSSWTATNWLYPAANMALWPGQNLTLPDENYPNKGPVNKLTFWAKGATGGEKVEFYVGGLGTQNDVQPESLRPAVSTGYVHLTTDWQQFTLDLRGKDLSNVIRGFGWSTTNCANPQGATFYLDNIRFSYDRNMPPPKPPTIFPVYSDAAAVGNHYVPGGWMADATIPGNMAVDECWRQNPHSGETAIRLAYTGTGSNGWAGVYWVDPVDNWGDRPGGFDLTGVKRLTFWARSDTPDSDIKFMVGGIACGSATMIYPDSVCPAIEKRIKLSNSWQQYSIDFSGTNRDFGRLVGGFGWVSEKLTTFYLDDIVFEFQ